MVYSFARVGAVVRMRIGDYFDDGRRSWFRFHEKGGKRHEVPAHHNAQEYMDAYVQAGRLKEQDPKESLFRSVNRKHELTDGPLSRVEVFLMIKRRARAAGLPASTCCHTFRATGITAYLANGGALENAQAIAAHESPRTTKLYDRTSDEISLDEVERISI
jgi:integrase